ncbi:MAG: Brp/Blh family beta-carotene 15,15'-dioxygenase [Trueperaceae bacterium]
MTTTSQALALESRPPAGLERVPLGARRPDAVRAAARLAFPIASIGVGAALAALAWFALAPATAERAAFVPLLVGLVLFGLPHGALDHLVPARLGAAWGRRPLPMVLFLGGYVVLALGYLALWSVAPGLAFIGFLVATVAHWGQGDVDFLERFVGRRRAGPFGYAAAIVLRGALPVAIPVLVQTDVAQGLLASAAAAFGAGADGLDLSAPLVRGGLLLVLLVSGSVYALGLRRAWATPAGRWLDVGEVALLVALFAWVPAYLAIGAYFLFWHSLRHLARLLLLRDVDARAVAGGDLRGPVLRLTRDLVPITLIALLFLAALGAWAGPRIDGVGGFVALYLAWISALTMPHLAVVAWMDRAAAARSAT